MQEKIHYVIGFLVHFANAVYKLSIKYTLKYIYTVV
jgi:hypothetical protein